MRLKYRWHAIWHRMTNKENHISFLAGFSNTHLEGKNIIRSGSCIINSSLGMYSYISNDTYLENVKIGRFCSIGSRVKCIVGRHPTNEFISSSPFFYQSHDLKCENYFEEHKYVDEFYRVNIGNDVWIGDDVKIKEGVKIGNGAIIAIGAVVVKDIPDYAIVGGVPAQVIRYRFSLDQIDFLNKFEWWNKDIDWLHNNKLNFKSEIFWKQYYEMN